MFARPGKLDPVDPGSDLFDLIFHYFRDRDPKEKRMAPRDDRFRSVALITRFRNSSVSCFHAQSLPV